MDTLVMCRPGMLQNRLANLAPALNVITVGAPEDLCRHLRGRPVTLMVAGNLWTNTMQETVAQLTAGGFLEAVVVAVDPLDPAYVGGAIAAASAGIPCLIIDEQFGTRLSKYFEGATEQVLRILKQHCEANADVDKLLDALAASARDPVSMRDLAQQLHWSRSRLFGIASNAHLPAPRRCQALFQLLPALRILGTRGSAHDAAFVAGLADERSLRRALKRHFGWSLRTAREFDTWDNVVTRWKAVASGNPAVGQSW